MPQESEGSHDVSLMLGCFLADSDHLLCEILFVLFGFQLLLKWGNKILLAVLKMWRKCSASANTAIQQLLVTILDER